MIEDLDVDDFVIAYSFINESPFPESRFVNMVESMGWKLSDEMKIGAAKSNENVGEPKDYYEKDEFGVSYIQEAGAIIIQSDTLDKKRLNEEISKFDEKIREELKVEDSDIQKIQSSFEGKYWEGDDTTKYFRNKYNIDFDDIFDDDHTPFSLRIISKRKSDEPPKFDIRIEPFAKNIDYFYLDMSMTFDDIDETLAFVGTIENKISQLIVRVKENE